MTSMSPVRPRPKKQRPRRQRLKRSKVMTSGLAAKLSGLSHQTIIRLFDGGEIRGFKIPGSKHRRIQRDVLIAFMKKHKIPFGTDRRFSTGEVADICCISQQVVIRSFDRGGLKGFRIPVPDKAGASPFRRVPRSCLIDFMKRNDMAIERLDQWLMEEKRGQG